MLLATVLWVSCQGSINPRIHTGAQRWFEGPVRWLMMPDEERAFRRLEDNKDALDFIEEFWRRRDPTPEDADNPFRTTFFERASAADKLYAEGSLRGSLTDRGRVLVLFGSPSVLRFRQVAVPVLAPGRDHPEAKSRWMSQEVWAYPLDELPPGLIELLDGEELDQEVAFVFVAESRHTYLLEGEDYLELAVRAAVREP